MNNQGFILCLISLGLFEKERVASFPDHNGRQIITTCWEGSYRVNREPSKDENVPGLLRVSLDGLSDLKDSSGLLRCILPCEPWGDHTSLVMLPESCIYTCFMVETGAFYYPWYDKERHWKEGTLQQPLLGNYSSLDSEVINQHIVWAKKARINFFLTSWWGKGSFEDIVIKEKLSTACNENDFKYCLVYESSGLLQTDNRSIQIDSPDNLRKLESDFEYLSEEIFSSSSYYNIKGRPAVFLYLSRTFKGNITAVLDSLRDTCKSRGHNPYFIGDEVYWFDPHNKDIGHYEAYDAISLYNPHISLPQIISNYWNELPRLYKMWEIYCTSHNIEFIPTLIPGFDDTAVRPQDDHPPIRRDGQMFNQMLDLYMKQTDLGHLFICSWNEWHENTQIEPSIEEDILGVK